MKYCPKCKIEFHESFKFCVICGQTLTKIKEEKKIEKTKNSYNNIKIEQFYQESLKPREQELKSKISKDLTEEHKLNKLTGRLLILFFGIVLLLEIIGLTVFSELNPFSPGHIIPMALPIIGIFIGVVILNRAKKVSNLEEISDQSIIDKLNLNLYGSLDIPEMPVSWVLCVSFIVFMAITLMSLMFLLFLGFLVIFLASFVIYKVYQQLCLPKTKIFKEELQIIKYFPISRSQIIKWKQIHTFEIKKMLKRKSSSDGGAYIKEIQVLFLYLGYQNKTIKINLGKRDPELIKEFLNKAYGIKGLDLTELKSCIYHPEILPTCICNKCGGQFCSNCRELNPFSSYNREAKRFPKAEKDWICNKCAYLQFLKVSKITLVLSLIFVIISLMLTLGSSYNNLFPIISSIFSYPSSISLGVGTALTIRNINRLNNIDKNISFYDNKKETNNMLLSLFLILIILSIITYIINPDSLTKIIELIIFVSTFLFSFLSALLMKVFY